MKTLLSMFRLMEESGGESGGDTGGSTEKLLDALRQMVSSPVFYIVIGVIVLLIIGVYLFRRIVKPRHNAVAIVLRKGQIYKLIDENTPKYFMVPFKDKLGAIVNMGDRDLSSDKLFINDGPDALYKLHFSLKYKVTDPKVFYENSNEIESVILANINESLREYADQGNALVLTKEYRKNTKLILDLINGVIKDKGLVATDFKINYIEPMGRK